MPREPVLRNTCHGPRTSLPQRAFHSTDHVQQNISPNRPTRHRLRGERGGRGTTTSRTTTRASNELSPPKSACSGDAVLRTSTRGTVMGQCAPEDSISQCPFLQMIDTAGNPHADGSAAPGARPRHRPSRHRDPPATSRSHDNWMAARQTSCRQQTAPPQPRCSKDVTAHPHRPGARPGRPCPVPARSGQPLSGRSRFSPAFGTEFFLQLARPAGTTAREACWNYTAFFAQDS